MNRVPGLRQRLLAALLLLSPGACPQTSHTQTAAAAALDRTDLAGHPVSLRSLRGHVVLLNFWATWCAPCLAEMPVFASWQQESSLHGFQVIGVAMDDDPGPVKATVARLHLPYPTVMGDAPLARAYGGVLGLPVSVLLDRKGNVHRRYEGAVDLPALKRDVEQLLR